MVFQDLPPMPKELHAESCTEEVMTRWNSALKKHQVRLTETEVEENKHVQGIRLWKTLVTTFGAEYTLISVLGAAHYVIVFIAPQLLKPVIRFIQDDSKSILILLKC